MNELLKNIADYSFSIVVSVYLLLRMEKKIEELTKVIINLNIAILNLKEKQDCE